MMTRKGYECEASFSDFISPSGVICSFLHNDYGHLPDAMLVRQLGTNQQYGVLLSWISRF